MGDFHHNDIDSDFSKIYDQHFYNSQYYDYLSLQQQRSPVRNSPDDGLPPTVTHHQQQPYSNDDHALFSHPQSLQLGVTDTHDEVPDLAAAAPTNFVPVGPVPSSLFSSNLSESAYKRRLSAEDGIKYKKEVVPVAVRQIKPVRQNSNPSLKRKGRPDLMKSYSYTSPSTNAASTSVGSSQSVVPGSSGAGAGAPSAATSSGPGSKKPNFHLNLDQLKNSSVTSFDSTYTTTPTSNSHYPNHNLVIHDYDLNLDKELETITPGMKPPGTNENDYFDEFFMPSNFDGPEDLGTANDLNGINFDLYDKEYYHKPEDHVYKEDVNYRDRTHYHEQKHYHEQEHYHDHDTHHDNPEHEASDGYNSQFPAFNPNSLHHDNHDHSESYNKSPSTPMSNSSESKSPALIKSSSNQSISSMNSASSAKDKSKKKKLPKGATCNICGKFISRDLSRHLRIHDDVGRFRCVFPGHCSHKTGKFNRPYDYKKHLLHFHFEFDEKLGKTATNLTDKLPLMGNCKACNYRGKAQDWLDGHVLTGDERSRCRFVSRDANHH